MAKAEKNRTLEQLRDYVTQMREIPGDSIGGLDRSPCRDGIFEAGNGNYTKTATARTRPRKASMKESFKLCEIECP